MNRKNRGVMGCGRVSRCRGRVAVWPSSAQTNSNKYDVCIYFVQLKEKGNGLWHSGKSFAMFFFPFLCVAFHSAIIYYRNYMVTIQK